MMETNQQNQEKNHLWKLILSAMFYIIGFLSYYYDIDCDLHLAYYYYKKSSWVNFGFTFGFLLLPFFVRVIFNEITNYTKLSTRQRFKTYILSFFQLEMGYT